MRAIDHVGGVGTPKYDVRSSVICQQNYCNKHNLPMFAPSDGICYHCGRNIYLPHSESGKPGTYTGIPTFRAGCYHITGCPHCNYSFCD